MATNLLIESADFSTNGFHIGDITEFLEDYFIIGASISDDWAAAPRQVVQDIRCCVLCNSLPVGAYTKLKIKLKDGYDYVFGVGELNVGGNYWTGNEVQTTYKWMTSSQEAIAPVSQTNCVLHLNLRYDDNTTSFPDDVKLSDIVDYIALLQ